MLECTSLLAAPAPVAGLALAIGSVSAAIAGGAILAWRRVRLREREPAPVLAAPPQST